MIEIRLIDGHGHVDALAQVLFDCVHAGASVGFMDTLTLDEARTFYEGVAADVSAGGRLLLGAFDGDALVGSVQVLLATLPNGVYRGEIAKMLVSPGARRQGVATALLDRAEAEARLAGKQTLILDAVTGGDAYRVYARNGWVRVGDVPNFALFPDGRPCSTTYFFKAL